jgi:hypothetical protein
MGSNAKQSKNSIKQAAGQMTDDKRVEPKVRIGRGKIVVLSAVAAFALVFATSAPAKAYTAYPYQHCSWLGLADSICTSWTGGYPNGYVRTESSPTIYELRLLVCVSCAGQTTWSWLTAATSSPYTGYTPSVRAGKTSFYKSCMKKYSTSSWACVSNVDAVYLGD